MDKYQKRYLEHQKRKKVILQDIIKKRHSDRVFLDEPIPQERLDIIIKSMNFVPSSCNRKAISALEIFDRDRKSFLGGVLVGGVGWVHRADCILLLLADEDAYKEKLDYMKYLDTGVIVQQIYLQATELDVGVCFVNPNIRNQFKDLFYQAFHIPENLTFTGAIALGAIKKKRGNRC